jgi:hypothetical protein
MPPAAEPEHLSNHHRTTLRQIFQHPVSHNLEWHAVVSLLAAIGSVEERHHDGTVAVNVGTESAFLDAPVHKDTDVETVLRLRRLLAAAGYAPED